MSAASDFNITKGVLKKYKGAGGVVIVPEGVTVIGKSAFYYCESLQKVILPEGVTKIDVDAFCGCKNLKQIHLPESITTIEMEAFRGCGLEKIVIPFGVTEIAPNLFYDCFHLASVTLPEGITSIQQSAFWNCGKLTSVNIPKSVICICENAFLGCTNLEYLSLPNPNVIIGKGAFRGCRKLANDSGMILVKNTLFGYWGIAEEVAVPEGVTRIDDFAFARSSAKRILIPQSVKEIGAGAFASCISLQYISPLNPACKLSGEAFGENFPPELYKNLDSILPNMTDAMLKRFVVNRWQWKRMDNAVQQKIFASRQSPSIQTAYKEVLTQEELTQLVPAAAVWVMETLSGKATSKICNHAGSFLNEYHTYFSDDGVQQLYNALKAEKAGTKAVKLLEDNVKLMERLGNSVRVEADLPKAEKRIMQMLLETKRSVKDLEVQLKDMYSLTFKDLPELWYPDKSKAAPCVLAWLLTAHETTFTHPWNQKDVVAEYKQAGICPQAKEILEELNPARVQRAMLALACANLGITGRSKKMYLAYPICRYANEALMEDLTKKAPKWRSQVSGNDSPPLLTFRMACLYSETRAAMLFADKYDDLDKYAEIRGTDADTVRDQYLSDVGLDEQGGKVYDLGNQTVTARLQKDLSFLVELPTGKTVKSLPKKGADPDQYAVANGDFSELKKNTKKIVKNRVNLLHEDFLSGRARDAEAWKESCLKNPLLRQVSSLLVWVQDGRTFTLTDDGAVTNDGLDYIIGDGKIALAHPMEMLLTDLAAWQKYFTSKGIQQPFEQIWEPVVDVAYFAEDRYQDCMIPYYRFVGQKKHGIHVEDTDFHNSISISFEDCEAQVERIDFMRHMIEMDHRFAVQKISFPKLTRKVNHILAYLDKVTIFERIKKDDVTIASSLDGFTLAQITAFIQLAAQENCANVTAILLDYQNQHFADFDPMAQFSLEL